jgi:chromatin assembly factor 1 subunit B
MLWRARKTATGSAAAGEWGPVCCLRGHCSDVHDLAWSPRGDHLFSGSNDGSTIVWNLAKAKPTQIVRDHDHYVHGVAWDPADKHLVSVSCDRTVRVYSEPPQKAKAKRPFPAGGASSSSLPPEDPRDFECHTVIAKRTQSFGGAPSAPPQSKGAQADPRADDESEGGDFESPPPAAASSAAGLLGIPRSVKVNLFLDEVEYCFYRRPHWSPDGSFLLLPCGQYQSSPAGAPKPTTYVFSRDNLQTPCAHLPSPDKPVVAVRCSPVLYEHFASPPASASSAAAAAKPAPAGVPTDAGPGGEWMRGLPYRVLWAVATLDSVVVYDSSMRQPLVVASNVHYAALTDVAWLPDGNGIVASSMDGYCMVLRFRPSVLGTPLPADKLPAAMQPKEKPVENKPAAAPIQLLAVRKKEKPPPPAAPSAGRAAPQPTAVVQPPPASTGTGTGTGAGAGAGTGAGASAAAEQPAAAASVAPAPAAGAGEPTAKKPRRVAPTFVSTL